MCSTPSDGEAPLQARWSAARRASQLAAIRRVGSGEASAGNDFSQVRGDSARIPPPMRRDPTR